MTLWGLQKDLRMHNAMAAVKDTERLRQEAHARASQAVIRRGEIGHDIDLAGAGPERYAFRGCFLNRAMPSQDRR